MIIVVQVKMAELRIHNLKKKKTIEGNKTPELTFLSVFFNAFIPSATAESVGSFLLLLKKTFAIAQLQKHRPTDSCMLHVYC